MPTKSTTESILRGIQSLVRNHIDSVVIFAVILWANGPLIYGGSTEAFQFSRDTFSLSNAHQFITHPFTHVSWYHLLLDAVAFFSFYPSLQEKRLSLRLMFLVGSTLGSLTAALLSEPRILEIGFCGLSGIAHGLMAIWALELTFSPGSSITSRRIGIVSFTLVSAKCLWEWALNEPFWGFAHFNLMGTPIVACHAGGVAGGCFIALMSFRLSLRTGSKRFFNARSRESASKEGQFDKITT